eukprot:4726410-Pleurochrysis_carterae.AAC.4
MGCADLQRFCSQSPFLAVHTLPTAKSAKAGCDGRRALWRSSALRQHSRAALIERFDVPQVGGHVGGVVFVEGDDGWSERSGVDASFALKHARPVAIGGGTALLAQLHDELLLRWINALAHEPLARGAVDKGTINRGTSACARGHLAQGLAFLAHGLFDRLEREDRLIGNNCGVQHALCQHATRNNHFQSVRSRRDAQITSTHFFVQAKAQRHRFAILTPRVRLRLAAHLTVAANANAARVRIKDKAANLFFLSSSYDGLLVVVPSPQRKIVDCPRNTLRFTVGRVRLPRRTIATHRSTPLSTCRLVVLLAA